VIYHTFSSAGSPARLFCALMPQYHRPLQPGGTFFFTVVTHARARFLCEPRARQALHEVIAQCARRRPFELEAIVLLPDHFHPLIKLPTGDANFSTRLAAIKANFTRLWLTSGALELRQSESRTTHGHRAVWQKRFWDHCIRNDDDFANHLNYIHYNPVKHGLVTCPHLWPWSSFQKWVARGVYEMDWMCVCGGRKIVPPIFKEFEGYEME
jgi:putative transposase